MDQAGPVLFVKGGGATVARARASLPAPSSAPKKVHGEPARGLGAGAAVDEVKQGRGAVRPDSRRHANLNSLRPVRDAAP